MKKQFKILILLLILPFILIANDIDEGKYSKQKTIKKAYFVNPDAGIDIKNSYGNVTISTWNEDKIELDIVIKVSGDSESWVDKRLDDINVDIEALKSMVKAETKIANSGNGGRNNSIEINYTIKIPKNGNTKVNNNYGSIITSDLFANSNLTCKYGRIELAKLNGLSNIIRIDYCSKSTIESVKNATIDADYSGLTINEYGKINLSADYTNINFINGSDLKYECNYGKLNFGKINNLDGNGDYLSVKVDDIQNSLKIDTKYSKITVGVLDSKFNNFSIASEYTTIDVNYDAQASFDFNVTTKYANFKHGNELEVSYKNESGSTKSYQGFYRKSGDNKMTIRTEYGSINLLKK